MLISVYNNGDANDNDNMYIVIVIAQLSLSPVLKITAINLFCQPPFCKVICLMWTK